MDNDSPPPNNDSSRARRARRENAPRDGITSEHIRSSYKRELNTYGLASQFSITVRLHFVGHKGWVLVLGPKPSHFVSAPLNRRILKLLALSGQALRTFLYILFFNE